MLLAKRQTTVPAQASALKKSQRTETKNKEEVNDTRKANPPVVVVSPIPGVAVGPITPLLQMKHQPSGPSELMSHLGLRVTVREDSGGNRNVNCSSPGRRRKACQSPPVLEHLCP